MAATQYWLMKTEPDSFSIQDLARSPRQTTCWDGVRNYQARNFMRAMQPGDGVLFYHSSANPPAVVGTAVVVRAAYPDPTAWKPGDHHFDPKASPDNPIWDMVEIRLERIFDEPLGLDRLRGVKALAKMELLRKGSRLSVQPVSAGEFQTVLETADTSGPSEPKAKSKTPLRKRAASAPAAGRPKRS
jgi:predicted RNA-binding protein with PUA-like domain